MNRDDRHRTMGPAGFHPRLTVLLADAQERVDVSERVAQLLRDARPEGGDLDAEPTVLGPDDLDTLAQDVADQRLDSHARMRDELQSTLRSARDAQAAAATRRDEAAARARRIASHLQDCDDLMAEANGLNDAVEAASAALEERQAELNDAQERLQTALDQREAATQAIKDAEAQLAELEASQVDEATLRRRLEEAGRERADAEAVRAEILQAYQELEARSYERQATREQIGQERAELVARIEAPLYDPEPLREALNAFDDEADEHTVDPVAQSLAGEWLEVTDELGQIESALPPAPSDSELTYAEQQLGEIEGIVAELEATSRHSRLAPDARADIEAAHETVLAAEEMLDQSGSHPDLEHQLEVTRAAEQQVLAHYGYPTYLDFVMAEPEPGDAQNDLAEALRARRQAEDHLASLWAATEPPPVVVTLRSRQERIYREAAELLACDPGDSIVELLESHPVVPQQRTRALADALAAYGVDPVEVSVRDAALDLLLGIEREVDAREGLLQEVEQLDAELLALDEDESAEAGEGQELMESAQVAAADIEAVSADIAEIERELHDRSTNDERHLQRLAAAEELRAQLAAVSEALERSDDEYHSSVAEAEAAVAAAQAQLEQSTTAISDTSRKLRRIVEALPPALRPKPTDDPLADLPRLHDALATEAERAEAALTAADREHDRAQQLIDDTQADLDHLVSNVPTDEVLLEDFRAAVGEMIGHGREPMLLDDPFALMSTDERLILLEALAETAAHRPTFLLTDDPDTLSWAISLPEDTGAVTGLPAAPPVELTSPGGPDPSVPEHPGAVAPRTS